MVEKSAEEKAKEAKLILKEQLALLTETEGTRIAKTRQEREKDEALGKRRGEELFGKEALGRVRTDPSGKSLQLQRDREQSLISQRAQSAEDVKGREAEITRGTSELDKLIAARTDPNSELAKLQRSSGREQINRALQGQLGQIRAAGNVAQSGVSQALVGDALGGALQARAGLERDLLLGGLSAAEDLTLQREGLRERGTSAKEDLRSRGRAEETALRDRLEGLQGQIQDDQLRRQLINLDQRKQELFGKLSTEQNIVAQGVAERSGVRQQILAEVGAAESTRAQREAEELQRAEIAKPPPSSGGGGGKVICGELHRQGLLDDVTYQGDLAYAVGMNPDVVAGYQIWAIQYVELMKVSKVATYMAYPIGKAWATEMAYRAGYLKKGSIAGKIISFLGEPVCDLIGKAMRLFKCNRVEA
jgi:hypothetical protein